MIDYICSRCGAEVYPYNRREFDFDTYTSSSNGQFSLICDPSNYKMGHEPDYHKGVDPLEYLMKLAEGKDV